MPVIRSTISGVAPGVPPAGITIYLSSQRDMKNKFPRGTAVTPDQVRRWAEAARATVCRPTAYRSPERRLDELFGETYRSCLPMLRVIALKILPGKDADDAVQEAAARTWTTQPELASQPDALRRYLPDVRTTGASAGLHVLALLPAGLDEAAVMARALAAGVKVTGLRHTYQDVAHAPGGLILGYGQVTPAQIDEGVQLLAEAVGAAG